MNVNFNGSGGGYSIQTPNEDRLQNPISPSSDFLPVPNVYMRSTGETVHFFSCVFLFVFFSSDLSSQVCSKTYTKAEKK